MLGRKRPYSPTMFSYCLGAIQEEHGFSSEIEVESEDVAAGDHQLIAFLAAGWKFFLEERTK